MEQYSIHISCQAVCRTQWPLHAASLIDQMLHRRCPAAQRSAAKQAVSRMNRLVIKVLVMDDSINLISKNINLKLTFQSSWHHGDYTNNIATKMQFKNKWN